MKKRDDSSATTGNISMLIRAAREGEGLTQQELADRAGMFRASLVRLERASYDGHSIATLRRIADALGLDLEVRFKRPKKPAR